jgi:hypothetical protein
VGDIVNYEDDEKSLNTEQNADNAFTYANALAMMNQMSQRRSQDEIMPPVVGNADLEKALHESRIK